MSITRRIAATTAAAGVIAAVTLGGAAPASAAYSAVESCTGLSGSITYSPGLTTTVKTQHAVFTGTLSGCAGLNGAQAGTGTITAILNGNTQGVSTDFLLRVLYALGCRTTPTFSTIRRAA